MGGRASKAQKNDRLCNVVDQTYERDGKKYTVFGWFNKKGKQVDAPQNRPWSHSNKCKKHTKVEKARGRKDDRGNYDDEYI